MKRLLVALAVSCLLAPVPWLSAQDADVPKAALYEIGRRGDLVEHVDGFQSDAEQAFGDAIGIPADDSHKWFLSIIAMRGCQYCDQLRADFQNAAALKQWADPSDAKASWAHFQLFDIADRTQAWRWKELQAAGVPLNQFPVLILQPPVSGAWGDPKTVVFMRVGYSSGKAEELDQQLRKAIEAYARKVFPQHQAWLEKSSQTQLAKSGHREEGIEQTAPFPVPLPFPAPTPQPQVQPFPVQIPPVVIQPQPQPVQPAPAPVTPAPSPVGGWVTAILALLGVSKVMSLVMGIWAIYRAGRKAQGKELIVPDDIFAAFQHFLAAQKKPAS